MQVGQGSHAGNCARANVHEGLLEVAVLVFDGAIGEDGKGGGDALGSGFDGDGWRLDAVFG